VIELYSQLVNVGSYMIVEDTICRHGLDVGPEPGPMESVAEFKRTNRQFVSDDSHSFGISWNETGYLKRIE
jgi:cephalosporin hydroxylase